MANFTTAITNREVFVAGNKRVVTGSIVVTTAASADDTVFPGLQVITAVSGQWEGAPTTVQIADYNISISTVTRGGIRITHATTIDNTPITFRAEGR